MDRGAWQAMVRGVAESWTRLKRLSTHMSKLPSLSGLSLSFPWSRLSQGFECKKFICEVIPGNAQKEWESETGKGGNHIGGIKQEFCLGVTETQSCWDSSKKQWETQLRVAPPKGEKAGVIISSRVNASHCLRFSQGVWTPWPFCLSPHWRAKHSFWVENALQQRDAGSQWTTGADCLHMNSRGVKGTRAGHGCIFPGAFLEPLIAMPRSKSLWPWLSFRVVFSHISDIRT